MARKASSKPADSSGKCAWVQHLVSVSLKSSPGLQPVNPPSDRLKPSITFGDANAPAIVGSSNESGDRPARSAILKPKAKPQSQPRQRDIRRALIEADFVDTAQRQSASSQSEAIPQVLSEAKNNMVALPGQLFYRTQFPICLWFLWKKDMCGNTHTFAETALALAA